MKNLSFTILILLTTFLCQIKAQTTYVNHVPASVTARSEYNEINFVGNLTDGDLNSFWRSRRNGGPNPNNPEWIHFTFDEPKTVRLISLSSVHLEQRVDDPKVFHIEAKVPKVDDESQMEWKVIYNSDGAIKFDAPSQTVDFEFENPVTSKDFKLVITKNKASYTKNTTLSEVSFMGSANTTATEENESDTCIDIDIIQARSEFNDRNQDDNLMDNDPNTFWRSKRNGGPNSNNPEWIEITYKEAFVANSIILTSTHLENDRVSDPKQFKVEAFNAITNSWTMIYSSDLTIKFDAAKQEKEFVFDNENYYKKYRLSITKNRASYTRNTALSEVKIIGTAECEDASESSTIGQLRSGSKNEALQSSENDCGYQNPNYQNVQLHCTRKYKIKTAGTNNFLVTRSDLNYVTFSIVMGDINTDRYMTWEFIYDPISESHYIYDNVGGKFLYYSEIGLADVSDFSRDEERFKWIVEENGVGRYKFKSLFVGDTPEDKLFTLFSGSQSWEIDFDPVSTNPTCPYVPPHKLKANWQINRFDWTGGDTRNDGGLGNNSVDRDKIINIAEVLSSDAAAGQVTEGTVKNPFYDDSSDGITANENGDNADYLWFEGWEVLSYNFGYAYPDKDTCMDTELHEDANHNIKIPYLMMYNRFSGVIRVMGLVGNLSSKNMMDITLSLKGGQKTNMLGLAQGRALNSLPNGELTFSTQLPSNAQGFGEWIYADFQIAYDPCTPMNSGNLQVSFTSYQIENISLAGRSTSIELPLGEGHVTDSDFLVGSIDQDNTGVFVLDQITSLDEESYSNTGELEVPGAGPLDYFSATSTLFTGSPDGLFDPAGIYGKGNKSTAIGQVFTAAEMIWSMTGSSSGASTQNINLPPPRPYVAYSEMKLEGYSNSKERSALEDEFWIAAPGSLNAQNGPDFSDRTNPIEGIVKSAPFYNEPLGVFTLVNQPELNVHVELEDYNYSLLVKKRLPYFGNCSTLREGRKRTQINKQRMKITASLGSYLNYTFNENLPINWDETSLSLTLRIKDVNVPGNTVLIHGDIDDQDSFNDLIQENFEITTFNSITAPYYATRDEVFDKVKYSSCNSVPGYKRAKCHTEKIIDLVENKDHGINPSIDFGNFFDGLLINDKGVIAKMRSGNIKETLESLKFELIVAGKIVYHGGNKTLDFMQKYPMTINPFVEKRSYTSEAIYPWSVYKSCIDIVETTGVNQGNVVIGGDYGTTPLPYTEYENVPDPKDAPIEGFSIVTAAQVQNNFCGTDAYQSVEYPRYNLSKLCYDSNDNIIPCDDDNASGNKVEFRESNKNYSIDDEDLFIEKPVKVYPNPTKDMINFDIDLSEGKNVKLVLFNSIGQEVKVVADEFLFSGSNTIRSNVSNLESGMYIYRLEIENEDPQSGRIVVKKDGF